MTSSRIDTSIPAGQPRLVAIAGPRSGEVLPVSAPELTIGRDPSNGLCLADLSLSRRHCAITLDGPAARIRDLRSSNGTFVNGMQISDHLLRDGDRIQLGESLFLFISEPSGPSAVPVTLSGSEPGAATVRLRLEDASYLRGDVPHASRPSRKERHLQALLTIATAMNTARKEEEIL